MEDVWTQAKNEYLFGKTTLKKLAEKYDLKLDALKKRSSKERWVEERTKAQQELHQKMQEKTVQKMAEKMSNQEAKRIEKLLRLADQLTEKLEQAISELDKQQEVTRRRHRVSQKKEDKAGRPYYDERITEKEERRTVEGPVDRQGLRQLAATLKDIQAVAAYAGGDEAENHDIRLIIAGEKAEELCQ